MHHLVGSHEIAAMLGVTRARVDQLSRQVGFPAPEVELRGGRVWSREAVEEWARATRRTLVPVAVLMVGEVRLRAPKGEALPPSAIEGWHLLGPQSDRTLCGLRVPEGRPQKPWSQVENSQGCTRCEEIDRGA